METAYDSLEKRRYGDVRADLEPGDLMFCCGEYKLSSIIRKVSGSMFSHSAIVFRWNGRVMLLESVESDGVRIIPMSQYFGDYENSGEPYNGRMFVARLNKQPNDASMRTLLARGADLINRKFDMEELTDILWRVTLGIGRHDEDDAYVCSELVDECFTAASIRFQRDERGFIYPRHIATDPKVEPLYELTP